MDDASVTWLRTIEGAHGLSFRMGRAAGRLVADWAGVARLTCESDGSDPLLVAHGGAPAHAVRKLEGAVKALLGDLAGHVGLHASAVALDSRGIVLLGESGAGKSTTAAMLCSHAGAHLLGDDTALLAQGEHGIEVLPCETEHYLAPTSEAALGAEVRRPFGAEKVSVPARSPGHAAVRLGLVVHLRFDDAAEVPQARRVSGYAAIERLLSAAIRFDTEDPVARRRELDRLVRVYEQAPFFEVVRPRRAPEVESIVLATARAGAPR